MMASFLRKLSVCLAAFVGLIASAEAEELVTSLSSADVQIQSNFTGTTIAVFGQVQRDARTVGRPGAYDLAIILEGPSERVTTRRKSRFLGLWVNRDAETFISVPSFYTIATTRPLAVMAPRATLEKFDLGLNSLDLAIPEGSQEISLAERIGFRLAFLRLREQSGLYSVRPRTVSFLTDTMFRTTFVLPATIPVGTYKVKAYLLHGGAVLTSTEDSLEVAKTGFEQLAYTMAHEYAVYYGIIAVVLALITGWLAGVIFRKD